MANERDNSRQVGESPTRPALRPLFLTIILGFAGYAAWLLWPADPENRDPFALSRADGKSRFFVTTYSLREMPTNLSIGQRVIWLWMDYRRRHGRPWGKPLFGPCKGAACSIHGILDQCMEATGTRYLIAVEIAGEVEFDTTNVLNGVQFAQAFEHAIETSKPVHCYDFAKRRNFMDTLLVIHERPGLVKIVPATKLADYQKAGLLKMPGP